MLFVAFTKVLIAGYILCQQFTYNCTFCPKAPIFCNHYKLCYIQSIKINKQQVKSYKNVKQIISLSKEVNFVNNFFSERAFRTSKLFSDFYITNYIDSAKNILVRLNAHLSGIIPPFFRVVRM